MTASTTASTFLVKSPPKLDGPVESYHLVQRQERQDPIVSAKQLMHFLHLFHREMIALCFHLLVNVLRIMQKLPTMNDINFLRLLVLAIS